MSDIVKAIEHARLRQVLEAPFGSSLPQLMPEARHGWAGEFLARFEPYTEADPAVMLAQLLAVFGTAIGRGPYFEVTGHRHRLNLFVMVVGKSSTGRKGTSLAPIIGECWGVAGKADPSLPQTSGLSSGEGLVSVIRDPCDAVPGVDDKRLLVIEPEFGAVLKRMRREGNTLSTVIREAWDGSPLRILNKLNPCEVKEPHVSIIGNITPKELQSHLGAVDASNGFGNRFLWCFSARRQSLPDPPTLSGDFVSSLSSSLARTIEWAKERGAVSWSAEAKAAWIAIYDTLTEGPGGRLEELTSRGTAQVMRLAALYALINRETRVELPHLVAALAVWRYTLESAHRIFEPDGIGDRFSAKLLDALRGAPEGLSGTGLHHATGNNASGSQMKEALEVLQKRGLVRMTKPERKGTRGAHYIATTTETTS